MRKAEVVVVPAAEWLDRIAGLVADGYCWLDFLTAVDRQADLDVIVRLVDPASHAAVLVQASVPVGSATLDSLADLLPGANWHERETAEMFGIAFTGHPDPRPLLTRPGSERPPLRKSTPLPARVLTPWPGAEPDSDRASARRRVQPPGILDTWETP